MLSSSSKSSKPKASDVASEAKKIYIPWVRKEFPHWPAYSVLYSLRDLPPPPVLTGPPHVTGFEVLAGDPVDLTIGWAGQLGADDCNPATKPFFICAANERRAGGDWETGVVGYEERLCRRSNLSVTLTTPASTSGDAAPSHYPIPITGAVLSPHVAVFRGPHDRYEPWPTACALPVVSLPPTRWPKLTANGTQYSFAEERDVVRCKMRVALRIAIHAGAQFITIGDFGLGNGYRNPPVEMAEMWREAFFYDPEVRGRIRAARFIFEDPAQSTVRCIAHEIAKDIAKREQKSRGGGGGSSSSKGKSKSSSNSSKGGGSSGGAVPASRGDEPTDFAIFQDVFHPTAIQLFLGATDPRYGITHLTS